MEDLTTKTRQELIEEIRSLAAREDKYRLIFQNMINGTALHEIITDESGKPVNYRFLEVNSSFERLTGLKAEEIIGKKVTEVIPGIENDSVNWIEIYGNVAISGEEKYLESYSEILERWYSIHAYSLKQGKFVTIFEDITEKKLSQEKQIEILNFYESISEKVLDGIWVTDKNDVIFYANSAMERIAGISKDHIIGNNVLNDFPEETTASFRHYYLEARNNLQPTWYETFVKTPSGKDSWQNGWLVPITIGSEFDGIICTIREITERKDVENELRKNQYYLQKSQEIGIIGTWELNLVKNNLIWTEENYKIFGVPEGTAMNYELFLDTIHPDDREFVNKKWTSAIETGEYDIEHRLIVDNKIKWVREKASFQFDDNGIAVSAIGVTQDITNYKISQQNLIDSENKFRMLADNTNDWEFWLNENGTYEYTSTSCQELTGYSKEDFYANPDLLFDLVHKEDRKRIIAHYKCGDEERTSQEYNTEFRIKAKDGTQKWIEHNCSSVFNENKKFIGRRGSNRDISARKKHELEQTLNELRLDALVQLNNMTDKTVNEIYQFTLNKAIELTRSAIGFLGFVNEEETMVTIYNWSDAAMKDCGVQNIFMEFDVAESGIWGEVVKKRDVTLINDYSAPNPLKRGFPKGHMELHNYLSIPILSNNKVVSIVSVANKEIDYSSADIKQLTLLLSGMWKSVEQRREKEELKKAKDSAEEADRLKSAFLSNMSHEIRTPMNGIIGFTNLLQRQNLTGEQQKKYIRLIQRSGHRMLDTVNDIIEISRIETDQIALSLKELHLPDQLEYLREFFQPEVDKKGMALEFTNLITPEEENIITDELKLSSVLINLIKNAIKYSSKGTIRVECKRNETHLLFSVADSGIGVPVERQKAIFERFVQADIEDTLAHEGSGLGLAISKSYVEMLGGEIWVESKKDEGSTFYFTISYVKAGNNKPDARIDNSAIADQLPRGLVVLIADDDDVSHLLLESILTEEDCSILHARNGIETINIYKNTPGIDLILMDIKMQQMDGIEATRLIRRMDQKIPIIAQSAYALEGDKKKAMDAGCNDYISKPIDPIEFITRINQHIIRKKDTV